MRFEPVRQNIVWLGAGLALTIAAAGCTTPGGLKPGQADNWGEANRQTFAAQIINPAPEYDTAFASSSGDHAAQAIERYRTDKIKQPIHQSLSSVGSKGGAGASASGGN